MSINSPLGGTTPKDNHKNVQPLSVICLTIVSHKKKKKKKKNCLKMIVAYFGKICVKEWDEAESSK